MSLEETSYEVIAGPSLESLIAEIEATFDSGDHASAGQLIKRNLIEAWFGFRPEHLRQMLSTIANSNMASRPFAVGMMNFFAASAGSGDDDGSALAALSDQTVMSPVFSQIAKATALRISGRSLDALRQFDRLDPGSQTVQTVFDTQGGWQLLLAVQSGVTAMLAGEFSRALTHFDAAKLHPLRGSLEFLTRDAYIKSAVIHCTFGDVKTARRDLAQASRLPRSTSWVEPLLDAEAAMVEALLSADAAEAINQFLDIPLRDVGELWPFYVVIMHRIYRRADRLHEFNTHLTRLEQLSFPYEKGVGFSGSVFRLTRAAMSIDRRDFEAARWFVSETDDSFMGSKILSAAIDLYDGQPQRAIDSVLRFSLHSNALRQCELWQQFILAHAYVSLDRPDEARVCLQATAQRCGPILASDLEFISPELNDFASATTGWPHHAMPRARAAATPLKEQPAGLTSREREILRLLARGTSRTEIAEELFISINTLKTHLKAIYRKMGVSNRDAALLRAKSEGWLF